MRPEMHKEQVVATFETLATYNPIKTKKEGRPIYDEQPVCRIRFAANKHTVGVFPAHEVFKQELNEHGVMEGVTYAMEYNDKYLQFMAGDAQTVAGTPLGVLPLVTAGKKLELKALNIHTVEALAGLDGQNLKNLGMNGRDLKNQAVAYLEQAAGLADTANFKEALAERDAEIAEMKAQLAALMAGKAPAPAATGSKSPFDDFGEDEDLRNWLREADPALAIDGRWGRAKLIALCEETNAKLRKAAA